MNCAKYVIVCITVMLIILATYFALRTKIKDTNEQLLHSGITDLKNGDFKSAYKKIRPYAEAGNQDAQRTLGDMYAYGLGVPYDEVQATIWFRRSESGMLETGLFAVLCG